MKKTLSLILALVLCLSLCACGNASSEQSRNPQMGQTGNPPAMSASQELAYELVSAEHPGGEGYIVCGVGNCTDSKIVIPSTYKGKSVTGINDNAFRECKWLTSVTIPDSVGYIGECAFYNCSELTSVTIPASIRYIGLYAFSYCSGLTSVTIPDGVRTIRVGAFADCSGLTSVTIPSSVEDLGYWAFQYCKNLKEITYTGTREQWDNIIEHVNSADFDPGTIIHCSDGDITVS